MTEEQEKQVRIFRELVNALDGRNVMDFFDFEKLRPEYEKAAKQAAEWQAWLRS